MTNLLSLYIHTEPNYVLPKICNKKLHSEMSEIEDSLSKKTSKR